MVLAKYARVGGLEENETDLLDLLVGSQKILDCSGGDLRGFLLWITVNSGGNCWKCERTYAVLEREE